MSKFIITKLDESNSDDKIAIFYSAAIGRRRKYRNSLKNPNKGLKILSFSKKDNAQKVCDEVNTVHKSNFQVESIS